MARTKDPHGASVKSWETRARNAGGGGVAFMERLWRDKTMWQPKGQADFHPQRRGT